MATIKSYTDISQSKKLEEILLLKSADMIWDLTIPDLPTIRAIPYEDSDYSNKYLNIIPCWSLAALLNVLPEYNLQRTDWTNKTEYKIVVTINDDNYASGNYDNPLDAAYKLILKVNELNLL